MDNQIRAALEGVLTDHGVLVGIDRISGKVSETQEYIFFGVSGAITGAIFGVVSGCKAFFALKDIIKNERLLRWTRAGIMSVTGFVTGSGEAVAFQLWHGSSLEELDWKEIVTIGGISALCSGGLFFVGDKVMGSEKFRSFMTIISRKNLKGQAEKISKNMVRAHKWLSPTYRKLIMLHAKTIGLIHDHGALVRAKILPKEPPLPKIKYLRTVAEGWVKKEPQRVKEYKKLINKYKKTA